MSEVAVVESAPVTAGKKKGKRVNSPSAAQFAIVWNASSNRQDALDRFKTQGFHMTYSAMTARVKSYTEKNVTLKDMPAGKRGRKINVEQVNAEIAEAAAASAVTE